MKISRYTLSRLISPHLYLPAAALSLGSRRHQPASRVLSYGTAAAPFIAFPHMIFRLSRSLSRHATPRRRAAPLLRLKQAHRQIRLKAARSFPLMGISAFQESRLGFRDFGVTPQHGRRDFSMGGRWRVIGTAGEGSISPRPRADAISPVCCCCWLPGSASLRVTLLID